MSTPQPTIIFVPGAWHIPAHYAPIITRLRDAGYEVADLRHPSCTVTSDPGNMLQEDANAVANVVRNVLASGKDAVLIMHSYGGLTGSEGAAIVCEEQKASPGDGYGRVRRLVFLAAHLRDKGTSFEGNNGMRITGVEYGENGMLTHHLPLQRFYNDVDPADAQPALDMLVSMAHSAFTTPTRCAGWKDYGIPCTYVKCLKDVAVTSQTREKYIGWMREAGVGVEEVEIQASHSPFWSDPEGLLEVLKGIVR